ncbi:MAG: ClbS/DfsB family four-helix bundle protein [Rhodospirillum sp.]|nr:ClbS/DfsB family four-helix bundle protein [Rhodospirillum sp.]MCF8492010.1 ClbS/DfsB family four-helix bundle protein [Rhodospirillum sp.]
MPAATTKDALIQRTEQEYENLEKLIVCLRPDQALRIHAEGPSIKDLIGHRAHWIDLFLGWYAEGQTGNKVAIPAVGYNWSQLKDYNAKVREEQKILDWGGLRTLLAKNHGVLLTFMEEHSQETLYGGPMPGGGSKWTTGRWAEAAGPSHYRSASKWIRACLRQDALSRQPLGAECL